MGKKTYFLGGLVALAIGAVVWAQSTPFIPEIEARFQKAEKEQTLRFVYDTAVNGGTLAAYGLGVYLPANAMITQSFMYVTTQFVDSGSGTLAISCEDANNILTATDVTGTSAGGKIAGNQTGTAANMTAAIAARCEVTATLANAGGGNIGASAGKIVGFLRYVIIE